MKFCFVRSISNHNIQQNLLGRRFYISKNLLPSISKHVTKFMEDTGEFDDIIKEERVTNVGAWDGELGEKVS